MAKAKKKPVRKAAKRPKPRLKGDPDALERFRLIAQRFADEINIDKDAMGVVCSAAGDMIINSFPEHTRVVAAHAAIYMAGVGYGYQLANEPDASKAKLDAVLDMRFEQIRKIAHAAFECNPLFQGMRNGDGELLN